MTSSLSEVAELKQKGIFLQSYPNPPNTSFKIVYATTDNDQKPTIIIHDLKGRQVKAFALETGSGNLTVDTNGLQNGLYLLTLTGNGKALLTNKIIVSR